jgi:hypothetical protein
LRNIIKTLKVEVSKLESELESSKQLDKIIDENLVRNQRKTTLKECQSALQAIEHNASKRATLELYIYSQPNPSKIVLNANQPYSLKLITLQEIEFKSMNNPNEVITLYWNKSNRLTLYSEFKDRADRLLKKIESEELDEYMCYSASEIFYMILGIQGELLEQLGIDISRSHTTTRLNQILQRARDNLSFFTGWVHNGKKE